MVLESASVPWAPGDGRTGSGAVGSNARGPHFSLTLAPPFSTFHSKEGRARGEVRHCVRFLSPLSAAIPAPPKPVSSSAAGGTHHLRRQLRDGAGLPPSLTKCLIWCPGTPGQALELIGVGWAAHPEDGQVSERNTVTVRVRKRNWLRAKGSS